MNTEKFGVPESAKALAKSVASIELPEARLLKEAQQMKTLMDASGGRAALEAMKFSEADTWLVPLKKFAERQSAWPRAADLAFQGLAASNLRQMQQIADGISKTHRDFESIVNSFKNQIDASIFEVPALHRLAGLDSFQRIADLASVSIQPSEAVLRSIDNFQQALRSVADTDFGRVAEEVAQYGTAKAGDGDEGRERVEGATDSAQRIVSKAAQEPTLQEAVDQIVAAIAASKKEPLLQRILLQILYPLFLVMCAPIFDHYIKVGLSDGGQATKKEVKQEAIKAVGDVRTLAPYRFVDAKALVVRTGPGAKSPSVGELRFGQAVYVVDKQGAFSLILWTSSDGNSQIKGWVFSRYLRKFG
jgi:hypothetical protein